MIGLHPIHISLAQSIRILYLLSRGSKPPSYSLVVLLYLSGVIHQKKNIYLVWG